MANIFENRNTVVGTTSLTPTETSGNAWYQTAYPTAVTGRYNGIRMEVYLNPAAASNAGAYAIRGVAGVKAGATVAAADTQTYLAGVQGKLLVQATGTLGGASGAGVYACAVLAQVDSAAGTYGANCQVYALWVDNQRAAGGEGLFHMVNITNNGGTVDNMVFMYGNNAIADCVFNFNTMGSSVVSASGVTTIAKALKCKVDGTVHYIPLCTGTT